MPLLSGGRIVANCSSLRLTDHAVSWDPCDFDCLAKNLNRLGKVIPVHPDIHDQLSMEQFLSLRNVVVEHPARRRDLFELTLDKAGLSRSVALYLPNHLTVPFILQDSDLIATLPRPLANKLAPLCNLQICEPPLVTAPIEVKQFWHRCYQRSPRHTWLRGIVREISQNKPYLTA